MARTLKETYGFQHVRTFFDGEATRDTIMSWLRDELPGQVGSNDRCVFFFAGHGKTRKSGQGDVRGYLIPYGARQDRYADYVDMSELQDACRWIPAKHILIILDCCFSGVAAITARAVPPAPPQLLNDVFVKRITERPAWQILTAGASDEFAADSGARPGHSAFTGALLAGLEGAADQNEDGIITATELANYVRPQVTRETASGRAQGQTPFFNYLVGSGQGDLIFLRPGQEIKIQQAGPIQREIQPILKRYPWLWAVVALTLIGLTMLAWYVLDRMSDTNNQLSRVYSTLTALPAALTADWASATAAEDRAIIEARATEFVRNSAATLTAIAAVQTAQPTPTFTPLATPTVLPTATPSPEPTRTSTSTVSPEPTHTLTATLSPSPSPTATFTPTPLPSEIVDGYGVPMVFVPAGPFVRGSSNGESDEAPPATITLDTFYIDKHQVTNARYVDFLNSENILPDAPQLGLWVDMDDKDTMIEFRDNEWGFKDGKADYPMVEVSWAGADAYCRWREAKLPTEAEWEKAARGVDGRAYPWGNQDPSCDYANMPGCGSPLEQVHTMEKGKSPYGAHHMAGNVWEWVNDWYDEAYYADAPGHDPPGPLTGEARVLRGGAASDTTSDMRAANRHSEDPAKTHGNVGFRCARSIE
jgi:formylglycine-generating enzyme required for sulfatase activity